MKPLKQRAIPRGTVEIVMRGSKWEQGEFSAHAVVPLFVAAEIIKYAWPQISQKQKQVKAPQDKKELK